MNMKKVISTFSASIMAVSALSVYSASATVDENTLSIDTEILTEGYITANGAVIPAGSTAVTVNISNNAGFSNKSLKMDLGSNELVLDEFGKPIIEHGNVLDNAIITGAENDGIVMFAAASADIITTDGNLFTFYILSDVNNISIVDIDAVVQMPSNNNILNLPVTRKTLYSYMIGDTNSNECIQISDASIILGAVGVYKSECSNDSLPVTIANNDMNKYFGNNNILCAEVADSDKNTYINSQDAEYVLSYYSIVAVGNIPTIDETAHVGEYDYIIL